MFPYVIVSNAIPIIAIIPLLTIWFGFGIAPKIMICSIISFFPIVTNTTRGLKSADRRIIEFMRSINATRPEILFKVQLPSALPFIFASFKIAASLALVGAVVAEFYSSDVGLGYLIITSATQLRTDLLFVAIVVLAALGVSSFMLFGLSRAQGHSRRADRGDAMTAVLIRDVLIVPPSGEMPFHGWVTVDDGKIAAVGQRTIARPVPANPSSRAAARHCSPDSSTRTPIRIPASRAAAPRACRSKVGWR